jgi:hypothetical protein
VSSVGGNYSLREGWAVAEMQLVKPKIYIATVEFRRMSNLVIMRVVGQDPKSIGRGALKVTRRFTVSSKTRMQMCDNAIYLRGSCYFYEEYAARSCDSEQDAEEYLDCCLKLGVHTKTTQEGWERVVIYDNDDDEK